MGACLSKAQEDGPKPEKKITTDAPGPVPVTKPAAQTALPVGETPVKSAENSNHVNEAEQRQQPAQAGPQSAKSNAQQQYLPPFQMQNGGAGGTSPESQRISPFANYPASPPPVSTQVDALKANGLSRQESAEMQAEFFEQDGYRAPELPDRSLERTRVHAVKRLGIDLESPEPSLDFITKLVTNVCVVAGAGINFIDSDRCFVKSAAGLPRVPPVDRRLSITLWTLLPLNPEVLVVEDLCADARFKEHPYVKKPPHLRFFAAAPLLDASGQRVGCLVICDYNRRKFDAESCNVLCNFAEMIMREVHRISDASISRSMSLNPTPENEQLLRSIDNCSDGVVLLDVRVARWLVLFSNEGWTVATGLSPVSGSLKCFWDMFQLPGVSSSRHPWEVYDEAMEHGETFKLDVILAGSSGKHLFPVTFKPATEALDDGMVSISIKVPAKRSSSLPSPNKTDRLFYFGTILRAPKRESSGGPQSVAGSLHRPQTLSLSSDEDLNQPPITGVKLGPLLGKGSFGSVHYGTWNGAQIAVKVIQHMATEAEKQARDEQLEAILGLKMLHPNIVRTFQFATKDRSGSSPPTLTQRTRMEMNGSIGEDGDATPMSQRRMMETWIVLELCNRGSLQEAIDKGAFRTKGAVLEGTPNMLNITRTAIEIAGAMSYLHSLDILHSDLNGNNILLISNTGIDDRPFSVKVSDFGLSRIHIGERTVATQTYGTVTHMPPELLAEGRLSKAADVYAFGVLLWEMFTGQRPWAGLRHVQIITHKMRNGTQLKWPSNTLPAFKDIAQRCMHPDPHQRPTFTEVLDMLEPIRELAESGNLALLQADPKSGTQGAFGGKQDLTGRNVGSMLGPVEDIPEEGPA